MAKSLSLYHSLGHEIFHAVDANRGMCNDVPYLGLARDEWQAVYRENILRMQMNVPLRTHYNLQVGENGYEPAEPKVLDMNNNPILPPGYTP